MFSRIQAITFTMKNYKKTDIEKQGLLDWKKGGCSRIFEAFGRLWAYFYPPFARLFLGRIPKRKKKRILPALGPPLARPVEQRTNRHAGRKKRPAGLRSLSARNGPGRTLSLIRHGPAPARRGTPDLARRAGASGVPLFERSARLRPFFFLT